MGVSTFDYFPHFPSSKVSQEILNIANNNYINKHPEDTYNIFTCQNKGVWYGFINWVSGKSSKFQDLGLPVFYVD